MSTSKKCPDFKSLVAKKQGIFVLIDIIVPNTVGTKILGLLEGKNLTRQTHHYIKLNLSLSPHSNWPGRPGQPQFR